MYPAVGLVFSGSSVTQRPKSEQSVEFQRIELEGSNVYRAILEAIADMSLVSGPIRRLGLPDKFVEHGERGELLAACGLDVTGIARACREASAGTHAASYSS